MIKSRKSFLRFYLVIFFTTVFYLALGLFLVNIYFDEGITGIKGIFFLIFIALLFFLGFYSPWVYLKSTYTISFDDKRLIFKSAFDFFELYWSEIDELQITGKVLFRYILPFPMEGTIIKTKDKDICLYDMLLAKPHMIKYALYTFYKTKKIPDDYDEIPVKSNETRFEKFILFKGNAIFSFRGILTWGFFLFMLSLPLINRPSPNKSLVIIIVIGTLWLILNSIFMNYFGLSDKYLVIRNHINPFKYKVYRLEDIKEVVYETMDKWPNCLRVITTRYHSKLFGAGTLRDKTWLEMKEYFESKQIKVRNECIY